MRSIVPVRCVRWLGSLVMALATLEPAAADVRLPAIFSDHMVLQNLRGAPVWGWADPREEVRVSIGDQTHMATADDQGRWSVRLGAMMPSQESRTLTVAGKNTLEIKDVLVGEVWLCSGQSNMAMPVARARFIEEEKSLATLPYIRVFTVSRRPAERPLDDVKGQWIVCSPETVEHFSATAYFFGRSFHHSISLGTIVVPVGLIVAAVGGTPIEAWTSREAQQNVAALAPILDPWKEREATFDEENAAAANQQALADWQSRADQARKHDRPVPRRPRLIVNPGEDPKAPSTLYNGMIAPLVGFGIRGAIWYQGENNANRAGTAHLYAVQLPILVADWRTQWRQGDFPFAWVQLPNFRAKVDAPQQTTGWTILREAMLDSLRTIPNGGMIVTIDVGEADDIHPKDKQSVGMRLAQWAIAKRGLLLPAIATGMGPIYSHHQIDGHEVTIYFDRGTTRLRTAGGRTRSRPTGFAIVGRDRKWYPAEARITERQQVVVSHPLVREPIAVRYAWADNPNGNLTNGFIPASPFRTDRWEE